MMTTTIDAATIRMWAIETAAKFCPFGTKEDDVLDVAKKFETFALGEWQAQAESVTQE